MKIPNLIQTTASEYIPIFKYITQKTTKHLTLSQRLVGWKINIPFSIKIGYIGDKVLGGHLVLPGYRLCLTKKSRHRDDTIHHWSHIVQQIEYIMPSFITDIADVINTYSHEFWNFASIQATSTNKVLNHILCSICLCILFVSWVSRSNIIKARNSTLHSWNITIITQDQNCCWTLIQATSKKPI